MSHLSDHQKFFTYYFALNIGNKTQKHLVVDLQAFERFELFLCIITHIDNQIAHKICSLYVW